MNRRTKQIWAILALLAVMAFILSWPLYKKYTVRAASASLQERTKQVVEKNPRLQPDWDKAMEDGVLTWSEANAILEKAGEKADPEN
jgi:hypothetical protein